MKLLLGIIFAALGYGALRIGLIPEDFAWETGFAVAIPLGLMLGWWLGGKLNNVQSFMFVLVGVSLLLAPTVFFGWMTVSEFVQYFHLKELWKYLAAFVLVAFVVFALADKVKEE